MKWQGTRKVVGLLLVFIFILASIPAQGAKPGGKAKELADVKQKLGKERHKVRKILRKESSVLQAINRLNKGIARSGKELARLRASRRRLEQKSKRAVKNLQVMEKEIKAFRSSFILRLRAMYKMRSGEILNMAFAPGARDPIDIARRHKYMTVITAHDSEILTAYETKLKARKKELDRLSALKSAIKKATARLLAKKEEQKRLKNDKETLLVDVRREKASGLKVLKELEEAARELSGLIAQLDEGQTVDYSGFGAMKGRLSMPVSGIIRSRYGKVRHPRFKTITFNKGIVISAPVGRRVKSVYAGRVIYTGWLKGYGQLIILDHGGGFYTLFAYLDKVLKTRGERVERGEAVALVGETGPYSEPGLYFEIRKKGVPEDPLKWLARR